MSDAKTIEDLRQRAAAMRAQGQAAPAARLDDLADKMQREGVNAAIKSTATVERKKGNHKKARALEQLVAPAPAPPATAIAAAFAGGIALLALAGGRRRV